MVRVAIGVVVLAVIVAGVWWGLSRFRGGDEPVDPPPTVPSSEAPPSPGPGSPSPGAGSGAPKELNCAGGNQIAAASQQPIFASSGLQYEAVDGWGFRYDKTQWSWLDDQAVWGTTEIEPADEDWAAGIAIGGVQAAEGFGDPKTATADLVTCMTRYGFANDGRWKVTEEESKDVTVDGLAGHRSVYLLSDGTEAEYPGYQVVALVLDTGQNGSFGTWMSFGPKGESKTAAQIEAAEKTVAQS